MNNIRFSFVVFLFLLALVVVLFDGCAQREYKPMVIVNVPGPSGHSSLIEQSAAPLELCATSGVLIATGLDSNDDKSLNTEEISQTSVVCNGSNGRDGVNGSDGSSGQDGTNGNDGINGVDGQAGRDGTNGTDGNDGSNGVDGHDAPPTSFSPVGIINPCGDAVNIYDEVFIKLANGMILASFSDNANRKNTRFSVLIPGIYQTTDGDNCVFTLDNQGNLTNEHH